ncbi:uncharacterized protein LOC134262407 [Saccostrea cucullata]|uniref:uncharacterized protein LOC134262407 n=1 Tax=Saccostrea cuccullata TaxID=36930 RepID=UPI002ED1646F
MTCRCAAQACHLAFGCISSNELSTDALSEENVVSSISVDTTNEQENIRKPVIPKEGSSSTLHLLVTDNIISNVTKADSAIGFFSTIALQKIHLTDNFSHEKKPYDAFKFAIDIGVASLLLLFFLVVCAYFMRKVVKCLRSKKNQSSQPRKPIRESGHYQSLESVPLINANDVLFEGLAEVKIQFNHERKNYTVEFETKSEVKEGRPEEGSKECCSHTGNLTSMVKDCRNHVTVENKKAIMLVQGNIEKQSPLIAKTDYIEMKSNNREGDNGDPYLSVVQNDK